MGCYTNPHPPFLPPHQLLSPDRYKPPSRQKLHSTILQRLHTKCVEEQKTFLQQSATGYGRALTGDGATILGTKFINFLVHEMGKGVMLVHVKNCTSRLEEVGSVDAKFIAHELNRAILAVGKKTVYLVVCDGGADWVATKDMIHDSTTISVGTFHALCGSRGVVDDKGYLQDI